MRIARHDVRNRILGNNLSSANCFFEQSLPIAKIYKLLRVT